MQKKSMNPSLIYLPLVLFTGILLVFLGCQKTESQLLNLNEDAVFEQQGRWFETQVRFSKDDARVLFSSLKKIISGKGEYVSGGHQRDYNPLGFYDSEGNLLIKLSVSNTVPREIMVNEKSAVRISEEEVQEIKNLIFELENIHFELK